MQREWWINNIGQNMLKGIPGDTDNPAFLPDAYILDFLARIPEARNSFERLLPLLSSEEQSRLSQLKQSAFKHQNFLDPIVVADTIQAKQNRLGIRTVGKYGGTRR